MPDGYAAPSLEERERAAERPGPGAAAGPETSPPEAPGRPVRAEQVRAEKSGGRSDRDDRRGRADTGEEDDADDDDRDEDEDHGDDDDGAKGRPGKKTKKKKGLLQRPILLGAMALVLVVAIVAGILWWLHSRHYVSTDDAFIDTHLVHVAPQISGQVARVAVADNQAVAAGQPLVEINSADVQTRVAQAEAQKAQAHAGVDTARVQIAVDEAAYRQALAEAAASAAQAKNAAQDLQRYLTLQRINAGAVAPQQIDQAEAQARASADQAAAAARQAKSREAQIAAARTQVTSGEDQVRAQDQVLREANINLGYARLVAPVAGHVANKTVEVGDYVQPGTELMAIVPNTLWVTANFKETELPSVRPGEKAQIKIDSCPKAKITGTVQSIERGAGQAFGVLPPENATGNWVKVTQRVPVKITLDDRPADCPLGPGLSVTAVVHIQ